MSFADLKKKSGSFDKLQAELEKVNNPVQSFADDRFWKPELDKSGNGFAVIRSFRNPLVKIYRGFGFGVMLSKDQVVGTLKTLSLR